MHINDFPTDSAEHVAQEALKATTGDHGRAMDLLVSALKVMQLWQRIADNPDVPANDTGD